MVAKHSYTENNTSEFTKITTLCFYYAMLQQCTKHVICYLFLNLYYLFICFVCMYVCIYVWAHVHAKVLAWTSEDHLWQSVLFFHHVSHGESNSCFQALQQALLCLLADPVSLISKTITWKTATFTISTLQCQEWLSSNSGVEFIVRFFFSSVLH